MTKLERLKKDAAKTANWRKHELSRWEHVNNAYVTRACAHCLTCGMVVSVNALPPPNDAEIAGEVVAVNCPGDRQPVKPDPSDAAGRFVVNVQERYDDLIGTRIELLEAAIELLWAGLTPAQKKRLAPELDKLAED